MIYPKLQTFLNKHPKKDKHTHSIYGGGDIECGGSYDIPSEKMSEFYKLLSKSLFREKNKISILIESKSCVTMTHVSALRMRAGIALAIRVSAHTCMYAAALLKLESLFREEKK